MHLLEESDKQEGAILQSSTFLSLLSENSGIEFASISIFARTFKLVWKMHFHMKHRKRSHTLETFKNAFFGGNRKIDTHTYFFLSILYFKVLSFAKVSLCWWRDYSERNSFVVSLSAGTMKLVWTLILLYVKKSCNDNLKQKSYSDGGDLIPMGPNDFKIQKGIQMETFLSS